MQKIDSHQHFWKFDPVRDSWITGDMSVIQKDFLPQHLLPELEKAGIHGCVAVQADQSEAQTDFLLSLAAENSFIKGIVGWVNLRADTIEDRLSFYANEKKIKGFRHILQGEEDRALMLKPAFVNGIAKLEKFGFTYDILILPDQLRFVQEFVQQYPNQKFVIDHIAKPDIKAGDMKEWKKDISLVAEQPNVWCKLSGMVTEADWKEWEGPHLTPHLDVVSDAFGADRLMFGSDWPVCLVASSYQQWVAVLKDYTASFSADEQAMLWGGTAISFYNLTTG